MNINSPIFCTNVECWSNSERNKLRKQECAGLYDTFKKVDQKSCHGGTKHYCQFTVKDTEHPVCYPEPHTG